MAESMALPVLENGGFGGAGLGAGFIGGLVLGSIWNGGGFGWGGRGAGQVGADVTIANGIQNLSNQVQNGALSQLQSAAQITAGINANTVSALQSQNTLQQQLCCACNGIARDIDTTGDQVTAAINAANSNIIAQGYESRLQAQSLAAQLQAQHAALSAQISDENCKDRELMRDIQAQAVRDQLAQCQAQNAALTAQINLTNQLTAQTAYLIDQLKTTTAAAGA